MKLGWSSISIISRFTAQGVGIIQSLVIVKILSVGNYGLIGLVGSIGAIVGVYQNLGISSASTREIAASRDRKDAFKVFTGSLLVRYAISLPLVIGLFAMAPYLGNVYYHRPEIIAPLRIFAIVLFIQALQSVLNSVIQGVKEFKFLFIFQALIAFASLVIYIPAVIKFGYIGYFYALLVFNLLSTIVLLAYVSRIFAENIELPAKEELVGIIKAVFSIGLFVYVIKIIFTQWQRLGPVILGKTLDNEMLGLFTFAIFVASKVMTISDAITDVTLPSMTEVYEKTKDKFHELFIKSNTKSFIFITFSAVMLILLKKEIFSVIDLLMAFIGKEPISEKYAGSFLIMDPLIIAFWAYSHMNLIKSGLAVPAKKLWGTLFSYILMFVSTIGLFVVLELEPVYAFSLAMAVGSVAGYISLALLVKPKVGFYPISLIDLRYLVLSVLIMGVYLWAGIPIVLGMIYLASTYYFYVKYIKG